MLADDYESMLRLHPEMILVSEDPVTWKGFLNISCQSNKEISPWFKMKLKVPSYPSLHDAQVYFGKEITLVSCPKFKQSVANLMQTATKASTFLKQMQSLIGRYLENSYCKDTNNCTIGSTGQILKDLKDAFNTCAEVRISSNHNLSAIKLTSNNVSLILQKTGDTNCPWKIMFSDLPEVPTLEPLDNNVSSLSTVINKFKLRVEVLTKTWNYLKEIDECCCVIDPVEPKPSDLYRCIYLSPSLSMLIKVNPLNPADLPQIKFFGSETEVQEKKNSLSDYLSHWDPTLTISQNLLILLDIYEFPKRETENISEEDGALSIEEECCICFCLKIEDQNLPDKICDNKKCMKHFHTWCLLQWLQKVPGNHVAFNHVHGSCPHCGESISCPTI